MTSKTWLNADGTYTAEIHATPINYKARDSSWQPIDTRLAPSPKSGFATANTANVLKTYLPAQSSGWVRVEAGNTSLSFRPLNTNADSALSASGNSASGTVWTNTHLTYTVRCAALKEILTLTGPGIPAAFSFALALNGLTATLNQDNSVTLNGAPDGTLVIPAPTMADASGRVSRKIGVSLTTTPDGLVYTLTPDAGFLATAKYPVMVDPTASYIIGASEVDALDEVYQTTTTWTPGVDPFGDPPFQYPGDYLAVGKDVDQYFSYQTWKWSSKITFSAPSGLPADADVVSTQFHIPNYGTGMSPAGGGDGYGDVIVDVADSYGTTTTASATPSAFVFPGNIPLNGLTRRLQDRDGSASVSDTVTLTPDDTMDFGTVLMLDRSGFFISITYLRGWYAFQGNSRHTGRAYTAVPSNAVAKWGLNISQPYKTTTVGGVPVDHTPALTPSLLAFPDPLYPNSPYPSLIAETSDGIGDSYVFRFTDWGSSGTLTSSSTYYHLAGKVVSGTPLLYGNVLFVTANDPTPTTSSPQGTGYLYILNASTLQLGTMYNNAPDPVVFSGPVYSSPAWDPQNVGVLVCVNEPSTSSQNGSGYDAYLHCLMPSTGAEATGWTPPMLTSTDDGDGTRPIIPPGTFSSPTVYGEVVYIGNSEGWVSAFDARTGGLLWQDQLYYGEGGGTESAEMQGSVTGLNGGIFASFRMDTDYPFAGNIRAVTPFLDRDGGFYSTDLWHFDRFGPNDLLGDVYTTPAHFAEKKTLLFGDDLGNIFGIGTEEDPNVVGQPTSKWIYTPLITVDDRGSRVPVRCSPLISTPMGATSATMFVAGGETTVNGIPQSHVYALDAETGAYYGKIKNSSGAVVEMNGKVRSSMASWNGRLYVLSTGTTDNSGYLTGNAQLFCFGAP